MSYILDALKNSDQQRQRGMTPTLLTSQAAAVAFEQPPYLFYAVLVAMLISAGIAIGWLRPWQSEPVVPEVKAVPVKPAVAHFQPSDTVPQPELPEIPQQAKTEMPLLKAYALEPMVTEESRPALKKDMSAPPIHRKAVSTAAEVEATSAPEKNTLADVSPGQSGERTVAELPASIQQEIPKISISGLIYSGDPEGRMVGINDQLVREGEYPAPGLKLEKITQDGVIFSYKKYRFSRSAQ
jgi:general secretion pathway protein B